MGQRSSTIFPKLRARRRRSPRESRRAAILPRCSSHQATTPSASCGCGFLHAQSSKLCCCLMPRHQPRTLIMGSWLTLGLTPQPLRSSDATEMKSLLNLAARKPLTSCSSGRPPHLSVAHRSPAAASRSSSGTVHASTRRPARQRGRSRPRARRARRARPSPGRHAGLVRACGRARLKWSSCSTSPRACAHRRLALHCPINEIKH
ncbi:hypothetical protein PVAP13_6KG014951 [Panicum virgatum]|uniref:Uncharacterized protein n=1 Tax=Panicum virgatum TaxID=38727 RepID=A0A8T0R7R9_PANVG|nr:hypothetical protein PVAP13_6KG014951 [Panicum virgatum]